MENLSNISNEKKKAIPTFYLRKESFAPWTPITQIKIICNGAPITNLYFQQKWLRNDSVSSMIQSKLLEEILNSNCVHD